MRYLLMTACFVLSMPSFANQTGIDYQKDQSVIAEHGSQVMNSATHFNTNVLPHYNSNPSQTGYYHGVDQYDSNLTAQGEAHLNEDVGGRTVYQNFATRPQININTQSSSIQTAKLIESDSYNLTHGIPDKNTDCQKHRVNCHTTYKQETCTQSHPVDMDCTEVPVVDAHYDNPILEKHTYSGTMAYQHNFSYRYHLPEGGGNIISFQFSSTGKQGFRGWSSYVFTLNGVNIGTMPPRGGDWTSWIGITANNIQVPVPSSGDIVLNVQGYNDDAIYTAPFTAVVEKEVDHKEVHVTWTSTCSPI